jgi:hypothetical protein
MGKAPASQFYWGDWRRDPAIRACSFSTRGIWFEMLCVMHECEPRGYFTLNSFPPTNEEGARIVGCTIVEFQAAIAELDKYHVMSRDCHGIIYNRRMVSDEADKEGWKLRQRKHRESSHGNVTGKSRVSSSSSSNLKQTSIVENLLKTQPKKKNQDMVLVRGKPTPLKEILKKDA